MDDDLKPYGSEELVEEDVEIPVSSFEVKCSLLDKAGAPYEEFYGKSYFYTKGFSIHNSLNVPLEIGYEEILDILEDNYEVTIILESEDRILLRELGYHFEDFLKQLIVLRNEFLAVHMLMDDKRIFEAQGEYGNISEDTCAEDFGECIARIYEKSLVILSFKKGPIRIPLSLISSISKEDYSLRIKTDYSEEFILKQLGGNLDIFEKHLNTALGKLSANMQAALKKLVPECNSMVLRRLSSLLRDGRAVNLSEIKTLSPTALALLENRIFKEAPQYEFIKSISLNDKLHIGLKRGLLGGLNSDYLWMMAPLINKDKSEITNIILMEVLSSEEGRATYFFRIMPWSDFLSSDEGSLLKRTDRVLKSLNECMIFIDFRREPIYMPQDRFEFPENLKYKIALQRLPSLRLLRNLYAGRVIHSSEDQWKRDVLSLIEFFESSKDDNGKWKKR